MEQTSYKDVYRNRQSYKPAIMPNNTRIPRARDLPLSPANHTNMATLLAILRAGGGHLDAWLLRRKKAPLGRLRWESLGRGGRHTWGVTAGWGQSRVLGKQSRG